MLTVKWKTNKQVSSGALRAMAKHLLMVGRKRLVADWSRKFANGPCSNPRRARRADAREANKKPSCLKASLPVIKSDFLPSCSAQQSSVHRAQSHKSAPRSHSLPSDERSHPLSGLIELQVRYFALLLRQEDTHQHRVSIGKKLQAESLIC